MKTTYYAIATITVAALLYEGWTLVNHTAGDTISEAVWSISTKRPIVPFALGFLMGHFFWQAAK